MIPKKIHYCWFGGAEMSPFIKKCMETWKKYLPDYELVLWNEEKFDINSIPFVKEAYESKKWAFVADYVRFYALYTEGGLYFDTDIKVLRSFPSTWLDRGFFSAHEVHPGLLVPEQINESFLPAKNNIKIDGFSILSAIMGSDVAHPFVKDCLDIYHNMDFLDKSGNIRNKGEIIIGQILIRAGLKYGYRFENVEMIIDKDMLILPSNILVGNSIHLDNDSYAIHLANGSWVEKRPWDKFMYTIRNNYPTIYPVLNFVNKASLKIMRIIKGSR